MHMRRRRLGKALTQLREAAGVSAERAATELGCSVKRIYHIENGRNVPRKPELAVLVGLYNSTPDVLATLEQVRLAGVKPGWWSAYRLPKWLDGYVSAEVEASRVRNFELELIPGLLQNEAYSRGMHESDKQVELRRRRQARLTAADPLSVHALVSEGALLRLSGADYAAAQLHHLLAMSELPHVVIQVLPFSAVCHNLSSGFVILDFPPEVGEPSAYLEYVGGGETVDDEHAVRVLSERFDYLAGRALSEQDSVKYLEKRLMEV